MLSFYCYLKVRFDELVSQPPPTKDERGLSQSTENAVLLAGAVVIAGIIITVITRYVTNELPG